MGDRDLRSHCRVGKMRATFAERGTTTAVVSLNRIELVFLKLSGLTLLGKLGCGKFPDPTENLAVWVSRVAVSPEVCLSTALPQPSRAGGGVLQ